jgi:ATP-dependent DNA ligase
MIKPTLCQTGTLKDLHRHGYAAECKYDGTRVLIERTGDAIQVYNRHQIDYTRRIPEFVAAGKRFSSRDFLLDGEAVYINPKTMQAEFTQCQRRCSTQDYGAQLFLQQKYPLVFKNFDIVRLNREDLTKRPYWERKKLLKRLVTSVKTGTIQYVPFRWDLPEFFAEIARMGEEGLIIKDKNSPYEIGTRSWSWMKIKNWRQIVCHIVGFTPGKKSRSFFFGSLVLEKDGKYIGCVGSGFNEWQLRRIKDIFADSPKVPQPFDIGEPYTAVKTNLQVRVQYYKITEAGVMREPVFLEIVE